MNSRVSLAYGRGEIEVSVRSGVDLEVLDKPSAPPRPEGSWSASQEVRRALANPIGSPPLAELAAGRRDAVIVVSDRTRPVPNRILLPELLGVLAEAGIPEAKTHILIATGLHRLATPEEQEEILGREITGTYSILQHQAQDAAMHRSIGISRYGIPIEIDRRYLDADLRIVTGLIEPHLMAGYSGGRKAVCPGLASADTIRVAHGARMLESHIGPGLLNGNPLHEDLTAIARSAGVDFMLNVSLDRDRNISGVFAGDLEAAFEAGCAAVERESLVSLAAPADIVLVSAGGDPLDATLYQAIKGIVAGASIVRQGGIILLCASLSEGLGSPSFERMLLEHVDAAAFEAHLEIDDFIGVDQWMLQHLCQALRRASVWLYSDRLDPSLRSRLWIRCVDDLQAALDRAIERSAGNARVAVIPQGPYVLATVEGQKRAVGRGLPAAELEPPPLA